MAVERDPWTAVVVLIGVIPGWKACHAFVWFGVKSKMGEAKTHLAAMCRAQQARLTRGEPTDKYRELGVEVWDGNRYAYFLAPAGMLELRTVYSGRGPHLPNVANPEATGVQVDVDRHGAGPGPRAISELDLPRRFFGGFALGANGTCPDCTWVFAAAGNIDVDEELDIWSVATRDRTEGDQTVPACEPFHERDEIPRAFPMIQRGR